MKKLMQVYVIFDLAYLNKADAQKVESEWSHKETVKEKYMYVSDNEVETIATEYGNLEIAHSEYVDLNNGLIECILYLQRNDSNGNAVDMIEEYQNGEIEVSTIREICTRVLTDWKNESTVPDDVKQLNELQDWIDTVNRSK